MHIVVTGSQSFIGRRLIELARACDITVTGIDQLPGGINDVAIDIRDPDLSAAMPADAEAVVHLAAVSRDGDCRENPVQAFDINVTGTLNVARACRQRGIAQLIFASTEWVYGEVSGAAMQREDQPIDVNRVGGEYALSKIAAERALAMEATREASAITILRFGIVYGPRPANWSAVESIYHQVATQPEINVGSLATARRFIHVDDIASGVLAAIGRTGYDVFNVSGDRLITLGEIIETSCRIHGRTPTVKETNPAGVSVRNPDNAKAVSAMDWRPAVDLETGLRSLEARQAVIA